jgi:hypothetical protein
MRVLKQSGGLLSEVCRHVLPALELAELVADGVGQLVGYV